MIKECYWPQTQRKILSKGAILNDTMGEDTKKKLAKQCNENLGRKRFFLNVGVKFRRTTSNMGE
jgi:hypothetical protein